MGRIISYDEKTGYNDGDYLLLDNGEGGTKRIRADRVGIQLDPTLTNPNKAAPANAVKPIDSTPTQGSSNAVSSGGVKSALDAVTAQIPAIDLTLTQSGQAADAAVVGEELTNLKEDISDIFSKQEINVPVQIGNITGITKKAGWTAAPSNIRIEMSDNASYDSYWFVTSKDVDVWFDSVSAGYLAIIVGGTYQSTHEASANAFYIFCENGSTRYRTLDSNLPTKNNKLHIPAGCAVAFTISAGAMESIYGLVTVEGENVKQSFKDEIVKRCYLKYSNSSGNDSSTEKVEIYIPTTSGYIRYDFLHSVKADTNADVWRVGYAHHVDDNLNDDFGITEQGEWECAVKLDGRDDFSGGYAHGDETYNNVVFIVDGKVVDITTLTSLTGFDNLSIVEDSDFYDPSDHETVYAKHGSEHHFSKDGLTIKQSIKFLSAVTAKEVYMAMLPIAKTVSDTVIPNNSFVPLSTSSPIRVYDTTDVIIYKTTGKVKAEFSVPRFEYLNTDFSFMCLDNGGNSYNKCYFVNNLLATSVAANKLLQSETVYKFDVSA